MDIDIAACSPYIGQLVAHLTFGVALRCYVRILGKLHFLSNFVFVDVLLDGGDTKTAFESCAGQFHVYPDLPPSGSGIAQKLRSLAHFENGEKQVKSQYAHTLFLCTQLLTRQGDAACATVVKYGVDILGTNASKVVMAGNVYTT